MGGYRIVVLMSDNSRSDYKSVRAVQAEDTCVKSPGLRQYRAGGTRNRSMWLGSKAPRMVARDESGRDPACSE